MGHLFGDDGSLRVSDIEREPSLTPFIGFSYEQTHLPTFQTLSQASIRFSRPYGDEERTRHP